MSVLSAAADVPAEMKRAEDFGRKAPSLLVRDKAEKLGVPIPDEAALASMIES